MTVSDEDEWMERAKCRGTDPDLFFPPTGSGLSIPVTICAACPVRSECLEYALAHNLTHGIWGGLSERERGRLRRKQRRDRLAADG